LKYSISVSIEDLEKATDLFFMASYNKVLTACEDFFPVQNSISISVKNVKEFFANNSKFFLVELNSYILEEDFNEFSELGHGEVGSCLELFHRVHKMSHRNFVKVIFNSDLFS
jgi:hypothetical protein